MLKFCPPILAAVAVAAPLAAQAQDDRLDVVASFSVIADIAENVGGDRVEVTALVGPGGDAHVYQPTPSAARAVAEADLLVVNGLGFEGWLERLVAASGYDGPVAVLSEGAETIPFGEAAHDHGHEGGHDHEEEHDHAEEHAHGDEHDHAHEEDHAHDHGGEVDPHAWQSLPNGAVYARNAAAAFTRADPDGAEAYAANLDAYLARIEALDGEARAAVATLPEDRRTVVTSHGAFGYFGHEYGLAFVSPQGVSTEAEPSAADVARLIRQVREEGVDAVFVENVADRRLVERVADETDAVVGGTLHSDALAADGPASTYLGMMRHNLETLTDALAPPS